MIEVIVGILLLLVGIIIVVMTKKPSVVPKVSDSTTPAKSGEKEKVSTASTLVS